MNATEATNTNFVLTELRRFSAFLLDHSFLNYKQEAEQYRNCVEKISLKEKWVHFVRIAAQ